MLDIKNFPHLPGVWMDFQSILEMFLKIDIVIY